MALELEWVKVYDVMMDRSVDRRAILIFVFGKFRQLQLLRWDTHVLTSAVCFVSCDFSTNAEKDRSRMPKSAYGVVRR